jgi:hypothetical protein
MSSTPQNVVLQLPSRVESLIVFYDMSGQVGLGWLLWVWLRAGYWGN